ncbi:MAG: L-threonylcarbamoyladenylate synthase [Nitrososphaeraceae archaeon]|nr:L-threonylcarbamoyladenylate synthase [Nitrososphaeraceae archaeon]
MIILNGKREEDLIKCKTIIKNGGIIVYPTDTIYGLGCDAYNKKSVEKIFRIKKRLLNKALPILTFDIRHVEKIMFLDDRGRKLADSFWPGPLTIIGILKDNDIPKLITAGRQTVGMRIPNNIETLNLLKYCNFLVGTSANISKQNSCIYAEDVLKSPLVGYDAIVIGDDDKPKEPFSVKGSTIVDISTSNLKIVREGVIKSETIYEILY